MEKKTNLFDHLGQPIASTNSEDDYNLPVATQAFIETRINSALDDLREQNRRDLGELSKEHAKKWRSLAIISTIITIIVTLYAPNKIITWMGNQIDKKLTEPMLINSADRLIDTKMNKYVSDKFEPLKQDASELKSTINIINEKIKEKQALLEIGQIDILEKLYIQELGIASKAGSKSAYLELIQKNDNPAKNKDLITATIKEIELFYDADRGRFSYPVLVKKETMEDPGFTVDEVVFSLRNNENLAEAAINTLSKLKSKATISELCKIVLSSNDLRAVTRAIRAIEIITEVKIQPLEFEKVRIWWEQNKDKKQFLGNYDGYCEVRSKMNQNIISQSDLDTFIESLSGTINSDSMALHSKCLKAGFLIIRNKINNAKLILDEVKKIKSDYYWYYVWEATLKIKEGDLEEAVSSVNLALKKSPTSDVVKTIKMWKIFNPIIENSKITWPINIDQALKSSDLKSPVAD